MYKKAGKALILFVAMMLCIAACSAERQSDRQDPLKKPETEEKTLRIMYLVNDASLEKNAMIISGIKKECEQLRVDLAIVNCSGRDSVFVSAIDGLDDTRVDALLVTAGNELLGPLVYEKTQQIGIPLLGVGCRLKNSEGQWLSYVDCGGYKCGLLGGQALTRRARERGFLDEEKKTEIVMVNMSNAVSVSQTMKGFEDALENGFPELFSTSFTMIEVSEADVDKQYLALNNYFGMLKEDTNYIFAAFNDEGAYAMHKYVEDNGITSEKVLICGVCPAVYANSIYSSDSSYANSCIYVDVDAVSIGINAVDTVARAIFEGCKTEDAELFSGAIVNHENFKEYLE